MLDLRKHFTLFPNCVPVKGAFKSAIFDLQRGSIFSIDNDTYNLLQTSKTSNLSRWKSQYPQNFNSILALVKFLLSEDLGILTDDVDSLPHIDSRFETYNLIDNMILEMDHKSIDRILKLNKSINNLLVEYIEIRFYGLLTSCDIENIMTFNAELDYDNILLKHQRIASIKLYNAPKNSSSENPRIEHSIGSFSNSCCGYIDSRFRVNMDIFFEAKDHNSCLHKKMSVDRNGNIKNCPSLNSTFGNIRDTALLDVIKIKEFRKYWNINKDTIETCKDCEFRYVCTDCRAYVEDPVSNDQKSINLSKPLKCGYNPYTGKWEDWAKDPSKKFALEYYRLD